MPSLNQVFLMGNLTRDPELKYTANQTPLCSFGLAVNRKWKDQSGNAKEEVLFVDCTAWQKTAELINEHFTKGKPIFIQGRLRLETWDVKDGNKRSKISVTVDSFQFIGGRDDGPAAGTRTPAADSDCPI